MIFRQIGLLLKYNLENADLNACVIILFVLNIGKKWYSQFLVWPHWIEAWLQYVMVSLNACQDTFFCFRFELISRQVYFSSLVGCSWHHSINDSRGRLTSSKRGSMIVWSVSWLTSSDQYKEQQNNIYYDDN